MNNKETEQHYIKSLKLKVSLFEKSYKIYKPLEILDKTPQIDTIKMRGVISLESLKILKDNTEI